MLHTLCSVNHVTWRGWSENKKPFSFSCPNPTPTCHCSFTSSLGKKARFEKWIFRKKKNEANRTRLTRDVGNSEMGWSFLTTTAFEPASFFLFLGYSVFNWINLPKLFLLSQFKSLSRCRVATVSHLRREKDLKVAQDVMIKEWGRKGKGGN